MLNERLHGSRGQLQCEIVDIYFPVFDAVRSAVDPAIKDAPTIEQRTLRDIADELTQALLFIPRDHSGRKEVVNLVLSLGPILDPEKISPDRLVQVVGIVERVVERSKCDLENVPPDVFIYRTSPNR